MNRGHLSSFNYFCYLRYFLLFLVCNGLAPAEIVLHIFRSFLNRCCLKNKIVICGSSIVARWHMLSWDMSPLPVVNCAISGSTTFNLSSIGLSPAAIVVIYVGSNDLKSGGNPKAIAGRLESFVDQLDNKKVVLVSSIKSPDRQNYWDKIEEYNRLQQEIVNKDPTKRVYVDVTSVLQEHLESFTCDGLHLTYSGFALFRDILKPVLQAEYDKLNQQQIEGDIESRMP